jgi:hypothetical protein
MTYTFLLAFAVALIFWASLWWFAGKVTDRFMAWKHQQYASKHFRQTERFRRDFE